MVAKKVVVKKPTKPISRKKKTTISHKKIKSVEKQVKFYRLVVDSDRSKLITNIPNILQHALGLPDSDNLYMPRESGNAEDSVLLKVHSSAKKEIILGAIRSDDFPGTENRRQISSLTVDPNTNLIEMTHIKFYDKNIVGVVYNHHGARISQFYPYLKHINAPITESFHVEALLKRDSASKLNEIPNITSGEISMHIPFVAQQDPASRTPEEAIQELAASLSDSQFIIKLVRIRNLEDQQKFWTLVKSLISTNNFREGLKIFKIRGKNIRTERTETIDFLKDQITQMRKIAKGNSKSRELDPQSAFKAIQLAYNDLQEELEAAISIDFHQ